MAILKEEDFVTNTYHRSLLDNIDRNDIRDEIMAARRMVHSLRPKISDDMANALSFRLELRAAFLRAIELSELRSNPESLSLPWSQMKAVWEPIYRSRHLGTPVPEAFSTKIQRRLTSTMPPRPIVQPSAEQTYELFQKLFADGIDVLKVLNYSDSQSLLVWILVFRFAAPSRPILTTCDVQNFVLTFQAQKPQPLVYIRTLLQNFLFRDMVILGHLSIRHVIDDDLSIVVLPCSPLLDPANDDVEAPQDPRFAIAHQMELFRQRTAQSYLDIFRAFCQNRCRVRRTLCHSIQDWETVQLDAGEIDQLLQVQLEEKPMLYKTVLVPNLTEPMYSVPLSSWAYLYKLRLMEWIVQLGFELETYQSDELAGMYWYLSYLAKTRAQHAERTKSFTLQRFNDLRAHHTFTPAMEAQFTRSLAYLRVTILDAAVTWEFADALACLYSALGRMRLIVPPPRPYSTDELRYDIRMKPFAPISLPALFSYEEFVEHTAQDDASTADLLEFARRGVVGARKGFESLAKLSEKEAFTARCHDRWLMGTKMCIRSIIVAGIIITALQKTLREPKYADYAAAMSGGGNTSGSKDGVDDVAMAELPYVIEIPKAGKCYHNWWIVPKLLEKH